MLLDYAQGGQGANAGGQGANGQGKLIKIVLKLLIRSSEQREEGYQPTYAGLTRAKPTSEPIPVENDSVVVQ